MSLFDRKIKPTDFLTKEELSRVTEAVCEAESNTSGEIRVKILSCMDKGVKNGREQAIHEFYREEMDKTRDKTGILILVILSTHHLEILADSGINEKVGLGTWDEIVLVMAAAMRQGKKCQALCDAVKIVGDILSRHFPRKSDDANELSDEVVQE